MLLLFIITCCVLYLIVDTVITLVIFFSRYESFHGIEREEIFHLIRGYYFKEHSVQYRRHKKTGAWQERKKCLFIETSMIGISRLVERFDWCDVSERKSQSMNKLLRQKTSE